MRKFRFWFIFTLALLLLIAVVPASASSPPLEVNFDVPTEIPDEGFPSFGPFSATGPAVDAGLICPTGDTIDVFVKASGFQSEFGVNLQVVKLFICDDGSGEFYIKLQVRIDQKGDNFNWTIIEGTGDYEKLHGTGSGVGFPIPEGVLDIYEGKVHID